MGGDDASGRSRGWLRAVDVEALLDQNPDFIFAKDRSSRFLFSNRAYASFVGSSPEAMIGRLDTEFMEVPEGVAASASFRSLDNEVLAGRVVTKSTVPAVRNGVLHLFEVNKVPLRDDHGEVVGVLTNAREVTGRQRAEEALRASEARYRLLLEHAPVAIYVHDGKHVLFGNRAFANLMGAAEPDALVGYPVIEIAHPDERAKLAARVRAIAEGLVVSPSMEFRLVRLDGQVTPVQVMATRCVYEGAPAVQVVILDETERQRAQAERVALETQLQHAQRLDALGTLAGGIAHDFNNLLAVIMANADLVRLELEPRHGAHASLDQLLIATSRASELVRAILAFGRKHPVKLAPLRLADSVLEAAKLLRATLPAGISLDVEVSSSDTHVVADAIQVHQAMMNLGTNAWHAMGTERAGRIVIRIETMIVDAAVRAHPELHVGRYVRVSVSDNGSGMTADTLAHAFDPFFTTKAVGIGTGLGLSVVHGIMRGHGGVVTASSTPGMGSELCLYFPATEAAARPSHASSEGTRPSLGDRHVLLVDDERMVLSVARRLLERMGLRVTAHGSLGTALAALTAEPHTFDVIVTDHNMPGGSGLDLLRLAQRLRPGLPVVMTSGYLDNAARDRAHELGVRVLLGKPFDATQLRAAIEAALDPGLTKPFEPST